jgi:hypothetical protein
LLAMILCGLGPAVSVNSPAVASTKSIEAGTIPVDSRGARKYDRSIMGFILLAI